MAIDDHPVQALKHQLALEELSRPPLAFQQLLDFASRLPLPRPFDKILGNLKDLFGADAQKRNQLLLETMSDEVQKLDSRVRASSTQLTPEEVNLQFEMSKDLLVDAMRRAAVTRSLERVKRIGLILVHGSIAPLSQEAADEIEEFMRVAMDLSEEDVEHLAQLVQIEGEAVGVNGRLTRSAAWALWEQGPWGKKTDPILDSVFSKLQSYGLVALIPPPNNLNITADFQNRYVLLKKGLRFANLCRRHATQE